MFEVWLSRSHGPEILDGAALGVFAFRRDGDRLIGGAYHVIRETADRLSVGSSTCAPDGRRIKRVLPLPLPLPRHRHTCA